MNVVMRYGLNTYFAKDLAITVCMCANFITNTGMCYLLS